MRWADLDMLGHVNNVTYVDYLQEARVDMLRIQGSRRHAGTDLAEGVVVVRHEVTYLRPLLFSFDVVRIECWVTDVRAASFTVAYEIFRDSTSRPGERTVFARASTVLTPFVFAEERPRRLTGEERARLERFREPGDGSSGPTPPAVPVPRTERGHFPVHVRFSDVDVYGHVNNVKYVEYFQEARLLFINRRLMADAPEGLGLPNFVIAQTDVDYRRPILLRPEPYDCWSRVSRVGTRSFTIESEIRDADVLLARAVVTVVFVDPDTGRSAEPPPPYRELLRSALAADAGDVA
jgi:acyl-CoA thioester hydrolase